jgi:hypothetical protein
MADSSLAAMRWDTSLPNRRKVMPYLIRQLFIFFAGYDPVLTEVEMNFLNFICDRLEEPDRSLMAAQIKQIKGVQRNAKGRIGILIVRSKVKQLTNAESRHIAEVSFRVKGRQRKLRLFVRQGVVAILETLCPLSEVKADEVTMIDVVFEPTSPHEVADALDRVEHGKPTR